MHGVFANAIRSVEFFFFQAEDGIRDGHVTGVQTCALPIAMESRAAQSPDALTGLEANLRFGPKETPETRIFGRLSAWQNWIFIRPNAVGPSGALKVYGTGAPVKFDWEKV